MKLKNIKVILAMILTLLFSLNSPMVVNGATLSQINNQNGILLDVARCPLSKSKIERVIDQINSEKINYLILHLNDDEHVGLQIKALGNEDSKNTLSVNDLEEITKHAQCHGLTLIPDFDTPGHCRTLIKLLQKHNPRLAKKICFDRNTLDYTKHETVSFVKRIYGELNQACGKQNTRYIMMGGDEVAASEANNRALIKYFNSLNKFENAHHFYSIIWNDSILKNNDLSSKIVIAYWAQGGANSSRKILQAEYNKRANVNDLKGHSLINANAGYNYFDLDDLNNSEYITVFINRLNSSSVRNFDLIDPQTLTSDPNCYQGTIRTNGRLVCLWGDKEKNIKFDQLLDLIKKLN